MKFQIYLFIFATLFTISVADTLLRSQPLKNDANGHPIEKVQGVKKPHSKEDYDLLRELIKEHRKKLEQKKAIIIFDENAEGIQKKKNIDTRKKLTVFFDEDSGDKRVAKRDTLLRSLESKRIAKRDTLLKSLQVLNEDGKPKHIAKRDTLLKSLPVQREDRRSVIIGFKNTVAPQRDALLNALRERYAHLNKIAKRDTLLKSLPAADKKDQKEDEKLAKMAARRRQAFEYFLKKKESLTRLNIAATVVGAAVSSVVSNLMKNVEESVVKAENDAKKFQSDLDSDQGQILGQGEIAQISQDVVSMLPGKKPAQINNEIVPLPFAPVKAHDAPKWNDIAPVRADVEVIVGNNATSTSAPVADKKGFFATLFNSFKLLFGTITNSVG
uniref:Secreted RxLR effector peptide protein n=1 Tax=Caenorhabditis tropicalis TaxID=1561998 RepID=A0A1I7UCE7_9PELO